MALKTIQPMFPDKLQLKLRDEGGIRALLSMVKSRHPDVLAQVARGIANFAKCESRGAVQGIKRVLCSFFQKILYRYLLDLGFLDRIKERSVIAN